MDLLHYRTLDYHINRYLLPDKQAPMIYMRLAQMLHFSRQHVWPCQQRPLAPSPLPRIHRYSYNPIDFTALSYRRSGYSFICPACGRVGMAANELSYRPVCSAMCSLAGRLFYFDARCLTGYLPATEIIPYSFKAQHSLYDPHRLGNPRNILRTNQWPHQLRIPYYARKNTLVGQFAEHYGPRYLSSILLPPPILAKVLNKLMSDDNPHSLPSLTSGTTAPALNNPVLRSATNVVLEQLQTANEILRATRDHKTKPQWTKEQVALFLGLYNRVTPAISASLNLNADFPRSPSEMTNEELEALARQRSMESTAKIAGPSKSKSKDTP